MKGKKTALSPDFPSKLRTLRKDRGWSQGQLAQKIGADLQRISKYERGVIWPTMELMVKIAKVFDVSVDFLIRDDCRIAHYLGLKSTLFSELNIVFKLFEQIVFSPWSFVGIGIGLTLPQGRCRWR